MWRLLLMFVFAAAEDPPLPYPHHLCVKSGYDFQDYTETYLNDEGTAQIPIKIKDRELVLNLKRVTDDNNIIQTRNVFYVFTKENWHMKPEEFLLTGIVGDDHSSKVFGYLLGGVFEGRVLVGDDKITLEKYDRLRNPKANMFHSIAYMDGEFDTDCVMRSYHQPPPTPLPLLMPQTRDMGGDDDDKSLHNDDNTRSCSTKVMIEEKMYKYVEERVQNEVEFLKQSTGVAPEVDVPSRVQQELVGFIYNTFSFSNEVYSSSLPQDVVFNLTVSKIEFYHDCSQKKFCFEGYPEFQLISVDFFDFCLGVLFTKQTLVMDDGTIAAGVSQKGAACGESYHTTSSRPRWFSRNFLVVSSTIKGHDVPARIVQHTLLHESAHSFNASHTDRYNDASCLKDENGETYIRQDGIKDVGTKFSSCAVNRMTEFLRYLIAIKPQGSRELIIRRGKYLGRMQENCFGHWNQGREVVIQPQEESAVEKRNFKPREESTLEKLGGWFKDKYDGAVKVFQ